MARSNTRLSTLCHKLLPVAILLALLIASVSQQTIAQNADASASASASSGSGSASSGGGGSTTGSAGGVLGAATGAIAGGIAGAQAGAKAGSEAGSSGSAEVSGSVGGVSGSLSVGGGGASASSSASSSSGGSDSSSSSSGSASTSSLGSGSDSGSGSASSSGAASVSASVSISTTAKPEGLFSKMKEIVKSGVDSLTHDDKKDNTMAQSGTAAQASGSLGSGSESGASAHVSTNVNSNSNSAGSGGNGGGLINKIKEGAKEMKDEVKSAFTGGEQANKGASASGSVKIGTSNSNVQIGGSVQANVGGDKKEGTLSKLVHKVENKASEIGDKIKRPFQDGQQSVHASASVQAQTQGQTQSQAQVQAQAQSGTEGSLAVQVLDKSHQAVKEPLAKALRPIDKALGVKQDPLLKMYDVGHEKLRQPLAIVSKPVESVFSGAFKTSDEAKQEAVRSGSEMDRREVRIRDEKLQKQGRSILGEITDRSVELAEKPFEIILRPVDRLLGLDKGGKKNPLIQLIDEIYGISRKPIDAVAKPFENILKKMADGDYQVSIRFNGNNDDPKLFTRLADGALNIADRIVTRPIEFAMRPLGYGEDRKNPIVDATHSLKNATKLGVELFTRPIDRIIKEIADIGAIKDEQQREAEMERKRQEASRIVHALDKIHQISQTPWEIVLRPVGKVLGYNKEGKKEPLLRAWDVVHQVVRTPIQVLSKPWEDAILGETQRARQAAKQAPKVQAKANVNVGQESHGKKNFFTEQIRKVEKLATKPFDIITSPIRRLILGEDNKSSSKVSAKAQVGGVQAKASAGAGSNQGPDKIVKTIEQMNNVVLKPLEVITQPISDMLSSETKQQQSKGVNVQAAASASSSGTSGQQTRAAGSISAGGISVSGSAAAKSG